MLVSATEHHAVLEAGEWLARHQGAELELLAVDECGRVRPEALRAAWAAAPQWAAVVSVTWTNNEVGTVNPIREPGAVAHEFDGPLLTDAVQAVGVLPVDFAGCGADALTLTGRKLSGPYGQGRCCCAGSLLAFRCCMGAGRSGTCGRARGSGGRARGGRGAGPGP